MPMRSTWWCRRVRIKRQRKRGLLCWEIGWRRGAVTYSVDGELLKGPAYVIVRNKGTGQFELRTSLCG